MTTSTSANGTTESSALLQRYVLQLADTSLILSHRLSEWCGVAPELEIDMALSNIALDLLGEARHLYQYASELDNQQRTEDDFAFLRHQSEFHNLLLAEHPNEGFDITLTRQFLFDSYHYLLLDALQQSSDPQLVAVARKSLKEVSYHQRFSRGWLVRLGDGTAESKQKMQLALDALWRFTPEMFVCSDAEQVLAEQGIAVDVASLKALWLETVTEACHEAGLNVPQTAHRRVGGKEGRHSEHLGYILAEMQFMQRAYPNSQW